MDEVIWVQCPKCLGYAIDAGMSGIVCPTCGALSLDECIALEVALKAAAALDYIDSDYGLTQAL